MKKRTLFLISALSLFAGAQAALVGEIKSDPITLPYFQGFDSAESLGDFTIFDENNDEKTWSWDTNTVNGEVYVAQNPSKAMDDWLVMRPVQLKANTDYYFSIDARRYRASDAERFEVYMGTLCDPSDLFTEVIPPSTPSSAYFTTYEKTIRVAADGLYYIGIHGTSDKWKSRLCIDNISLKAGASDSAPGQPLNFNATPDPDGWLTAKISFTTPPTDVDGNAISAITGVHIFRDDIEIHSIDITTIGTAVEWIDTDVPAGYHTYAAAASNANGVGAQAAKEIYVGLFRPDYPTNVVLKETDTYGVVTLSWDAPKYDTYNNPLDPSRITYKIVEWIGYDTNIIADDIEGTSYTFKAMEPGERQEFKAYHVYAKTNGGYSNVDGTSTTAAVGTPHAMPYNESFAIVNEHLVNPLAFEVTNGVGTWNLYDDNEYSLAGLKSQDSDDGYIGMYAKNTTHAAHFFTAKIDLAGTENPAVSYYTYKFASDDNNTVSLEVRTPENQFGTINTVAIGEIPGEGWVKVTVPMKRYRDRVVQIGILATTITDAYTLIDNLRVFDMKAKDVAVTTPEYNATMAPNEPLTVKFNVENNGYSDLSGITVKLLVDGDMADSAEIAEILSGEMAQVSLSATLGVWQTGDHTFQIVAECEGDGNTDDNSSDELTFTIVPTRYPEASDLTAAWNGSGVELNWTAADPASFIPDCVTDDFESYPAFANEGVGPWTFVDYDKGYIGGIGQGDNAIDFPGISGQQSWWVMDANYAELANVSYTYFWQAHSGSKYLMQEYGGDETLTYAVPCDDWIISPELTGHAQEVIFWAKSYNRYAPEAFEFMISYTDAEIESFTSLDYRYGLSDTWTEFSFDLPEGVRYFAIRCVSNNKMSLFVDDITYTPGVKLTLTGYNVYRDGLRLNSEPVAATTFVDAAPVADSHSYRITAQYDKGESGLCSEASIDLSGIANVNIETAGEATYYNMQGLRISAPIPGQPCIEVRPSSTRKVIL